MAKISENDTKPDEDELADLYYYHLWKQRLGWTRHIIPVRAFDAQTGFFVEAYMSIVSAVSDLKKQTAELKLACLPTEFFDTIHVKLTDIYPTARNLSLIRDDEIIQVEKTQKFLPTKTIGVNKLPKLFKAYKGCKFTLRELECMINDTIPMSEQKELVEAGEKQCSIEAKSATAYSGIGQTQVELEAVDLSEVHETFSALYTAYDGCTKCDLGKDRNCRNASLKITTGRLGGNTWGTIPAGSQADLMIIGEAPGVQEEETGLAFNASAPAGGVLRKVLDAARFDQDTVYYSNAVLCRPESKDKKTQNGKPQVSHIEACNKRLKNEIALIKPKAILLLGQNRI